MARPAVFRVLRSASLRRPRSVARPQPCQVHTSRIVGRFLMIALLWVVASAALLGSKVPVPPALKAVNDLAFLAFATAYLQAKILAALRRSRRRTAPTAR